MNLKKVRAFGLSSGGLDSILSALVLREQGVEVQWITFETPFFSSEKAMQAAHITKIPLIVKDITQVYLEMLKNPPCGYGKHLNPCMDCHALMFKIAGDAMKNDGFDFLFSGEVLGQRPMSQTKPSMRYVEKQSGYDGYILRPLSAIKLPETIPEKQGLIDRKLLYSLSGRSRKSQMELAKKFGISQYPSPAGGCLLTDKAYSNRLKDLFERQETYTPQELHLLKYGRHLRLNKCTKIIVGRNKNDNEKIQQYANPSIDTIFKVKNFPGPTVLMPHKSNQDDLMQVASICIGYSKAPNNVKIDVAVKSPTSNVIVKVTATPSDQIQHFLI